jgi:uncharacterized protein (TIGR02996 family)
VEPALLAAVLEAADDDPRPALVYADWLIEREDPRGRLIALTARPGREDEVEGWLAAHEQLRPAWWPLCLRASWRFGFVDTLTLFPTALGVGDLMYALDGRIHAETLGHALAHPSAQRVREVVLERLLGAHSWPAVLAAAPPSLRWISLRDSPQLRHMLRDHRPHRVRVLR